MNKKTYFLTLIILLFQFATFSNANANDYPNTSIAIIDMNAILNDSKVAINANEQIKEISNKVQENINDNEKMLIEEQKKLIESQQILAPEAFDERRIEYEKKVQDFQITSQEKLIELDKLIAEARSRILDETEPILEKIAEEKGITVILELNSVILNADNMNITKLVIKELNKNLSKIEIEFEE